MDVVTLAVDGPIAIISVNRPDKLNAINDDVLTGLVSTLDTVEGDSSVRAIVLRGEGRAFCAGADLSMVSHIVSDREAFNAFLDRWHAAFARVAESPLPTIAGVRGIAMAGGFELMQACDLVVVADDARVGDQHANFGLFPGGGSTQRLPRQTTMRNATWMLLSGEAIDGPTAVQWGLANRSVPADEVDDMAMSMARTLAQKSSSATTSMKEALRLGDGLPLSEAFARERHVALRQMGSADAAIGFEAFQSRTTPVFGTRDVPE